MNIETEDEIAGNHDGFLIKQRTYIPGKHVNACTGSTDQRKKQR